MKKNRFAYSLQEIIIAIAVVGVIAVLLLSMTARNRQHEFNAKLDKAEATISSIIEKNFILNTGREAADYHAEPVREIINNELKVEKDCTGSTRGKDFCWAEDSYGDYSTEKLLLKDNTSIALKDVASDGINNNIVTTFIFLDANGPKGPNKLDKDIRSLKITANKDRLNIASSKAWGECLCPNGMACPGNDINKCSAGGTCKCSNGLSCIVLSDCPAETPEVSGECKCSDDTACPAGNAKLCGGTSSGNCKCSNGNSCPNGTIASCVNDGGCICSDGKACPNGDSKKCTTKTQGICKCPDNKPCPDNDLSQCPNIGGCLCSNGTVCPDGKTTASCFTCEIPKSSCGLGYSLEDEDSPYCECKKNCKIESCEGKQDIIDENLSSCYCGCKNKPANFSDDIYNWDDEKCDKVCKHGIEDSDKENVRVLERQKTYDSRTCYYNYSCKDIGPLYVIWREGTDVKGVAGHDQTYGRTLKNVIQIGISGGLLPSDLADALQKENFNDYSFTKDKSKAKNCKVTYKKDGTIKSTDGECTTTETKNLKTVDFNVEAYVLDKDGNVVGYIKPEDSTFDRKTQTPGLKSSQTEYGLVDASKVTIDKTSGVKDVTINAKRNYSIKVGSKITIAGCEYDVYGSYRQGSPLVLDLKGNGFGFTSVKNGVSFDLDADGKTDNTAWTKKQKEFDDAFLVLDKNGNGQVDSGSELFGDQGGEDNGFLELKKYDDNGDGVIDKNDKVYSQLRLWADMNGNGHVDEGELKTLAEMGVTELSTSYNKILDQNGNASRDEHGNDVSITGWFKQIVEDVVDGIKTVVEKVKTMIDVFFNYVSGK